MNKAVQYNLLNAVTGVSPNFNLDHARMKFSLGKCPLPSNIDAETVAGAKINFAWGVSSQSKYGKDTDLVNLVVYNVDKDEFVILEKCGKPYGTCPLACNCRPTL